MDYEKKYEHALSVARETYQSQPMYRAWLKKMFPELSESEDEKVRKELIDFAIKANNGVTSILANNYDFNKWIAWLEKQGEEKPATDIKVIIPKFRVGDIVKSKSQPMLSPRKIISIDKDCYRCEDGGCIGFAWEDDYEIVEQKTAEWSEEDERFVHGLIRGLAAKRDIHGHTTFSSDCIDITETIDWLKLLKQRIGG